MGGETHRKLLWQSGLAQCGSSGSGDKWSSSGYILKELSMQFAHDWMWGERRGTQKKLEG